MMKRPKFFSKMMKRTIKVWGFLIRGFFVRGFFIGGFFIRGFSLWKGLDLRLFYWRLFIRGFFIQGFSVWKGLKIWGFFKLLHFLPNENLLSSMLTFVISSKKKLLIFEEWSSKIALVRVNIWHVFTPTAPKYTFKVFFQ